MNQNNPPAWATERLCDGELIEYSRRLGRVRSLDVELVLTSLPDEPGEPRFRIGGDRFSAADVGSLIDHLVTGLRLLGPCADAEPGASR